MWLAATPKDCAAFPQPVKALNFVQHGVAPPHFSPLRGFGGASVLEIKDDYAGDTYRVVYTVRLPKAIYVLDAFKKKSHRGGDLPREIAERIRQRILVAQRDYAERFESGEGAE